MNKFLSHCERASVHINRHAFPVIAGLYVRTDVLLIEVIPTSCVLFNAVARWPSLHSFSRRLPRSYRKGLLCYCTQGCTSDLLIGGHKCVAGYPALRQNDA